MLLGNDWIHSGAEIGTLLLLALGYKISRSGEIRQAHQNRDTERELQATMHAENRFKLDHLLAFRTDQEEINKKRDEQIGLLSNIASKTSESLVQITQGLDRRIELIEDELRDNRRKRGA